VRRLLLFTLAVAGCDGMARLSRADLVRTTWREVCPDPSIATAYVRLDVSSSRSSGADGRMAWSYTHPDSVRAEDVHTWAVEDGALLLRWNLGGATSRYPAGPDPRRFDADSSTFCVDDLPTIDRVR
jgi:hypothetical protein